MEGREWRGGATVALQNSKLIKRCHNKLTELTISAAKEHAPD